jgi:hypothetical protein
MAWSDLKQTVVDCFFQELSGDARYLNGVQDDLSYTLGKRNIAFRGNWNMETSEEDGNFMFFVNWKSSFDLVLKEHIEQKISYVKYLSPLAQNEYNNTECRLKAALDSSSLRIRLPLH